MNILEPKFLFTMDNGFYLKGTIASDQRTTFVGLYCPDLSEFQDISKLRNISQPQNNTLAPAQPEIIDIDILKCCDGLEVLDSLKVKPKRKKNPIPVFKFEQNENKQPKKNNGVVYSDDERYSNIIRAVSDISGTSQGVIRKFTRKNDLLCNSRSTCSWCSSKALFVYPGNTAIKSCFKHLNDSMISEMFLIDIIKCNYNTRGLNGKLNYKCANINIYYKSDDPEKRPIYCEHHHPEHVEIFLNMGILGKYKFYNIHEFAAKHNCQYA